MNESDRRKRNADKLAEVFPTVRDRIGKVIATLESQGLRPRIQEAWRSPADQKRARQDGRWKLRFGVYNVTAADGRPESLSVDLVDDDSPLNPGSSFLLYLAAAAESAGLVTGIRWGLPAKPAAAIDRAIAAKDWPAKVRIGWDPTHAQPADVTVAQAKAGKRPA